MTEDIRIRYSVDGVDKAAKDIDKVSTSLKNSGKTATESSSAFSKSVGKFTSGSKDMQRAFSMLSGTAIGAGIGGVGALGFGSIGKMASLPVFQMKEYVESTKGQMKGLQAALAGFGAGGMGGALAGGTMGGMLGGIAGGMLMPGVGNLVGGALGGLGGAALGGGAGSMIGAIGAMFAEATAKAEPFMQALLNMSTALQPLMDALVSFANTLAPAFEACYPAILGLSDLMAGFVNMIAGPAAGIITGFGQIFAVVFGILGDTTQSTGEKIVDIFILAIRGIATILDTVFIPIWNRTLDIIADITGTVMGSIANGIANSVIGAINGIISRVNGVLSFLHLGTIGEIGTVDLTGIAKQAMSQVTGQYKMSGSFNDLLDQLGVANIGDLAAKYGVDLSARGSAEKLTEAVKDLATKIDQKDMASKMTVEINVHQTFSGPVTQADLEKANAGVYDSVTKSLKGYGAAV